MTANPAETLLSTAAGVAPREKRRRGAVRDGVLVLRPIIKLAALGWRGKERGLSSPKVPSDNNCKKDVKKADKAQKRTRATVVR